MLGPLHNGGLALRKVRQRLGLSVSDPPLGVRIAPVNLIFIFFFFTIFICIFFLLLMTKTVPYSTPMDLVSRGNACADVVEKAAARVDEQHALYVYDPDTPTEPTADLQQ